MCCTSSKGSSLSASGLIASRAGGSAHSARASVSSRVPLTVIRSTRSLLFTKIREEQWQQKLSDMQSQEANEANLVSQLTNRLTQVRPPWPGYPRARRLTQAYIRPPQLQQEKDALEKAVEGQADAIALRLRLALLASEQQRPRSHSGHRGGSSHRHRHHSGSSSKPSPSSSVSTSVSTSSSTSFPSSPSTQLSPDLPAPDLSPDVIQALRENETLRVRLANSERVNAYYQRELAELRRRCGISIDELEELDLSEQPGARPALGTRTRSTSRGAAVSDWAHHAATSSIRIPGAVQSVSPPNSGSVGAGAAAARLSSVAFPFSSATSRYSAASGASSVNTTATTPSSSFPAARAPAPTPATAAAFSPASYGATLAAAGMGMGIGIGSTGAGPVAGPAVAVSHAAAARRNSLSGLVATHFAPPPSASSSRRPMSVAASAPSTGSSSATYGAARSPAPAAGPPGPGLDHPPQGIDVDDLLHLRVAAPPSLVLPAPAPAPASAASSSSAGSSSLAGGAESAASPSATGPAPAARPAPADDPLVAAITRSLAKLAAAGWGDPGSTPAEASSTSEEVDDAPGSDSDSSATGSGSGSGTAAEDGVREGRRGRAGVQAEAEGDDTPVSVSPGMTNRRGVARLVGAGRGTGAGAGRGLGRGRR